MCVSPVDGRLLVASSSQDETVRVWDVGTGRPVGDPLSGHGAPVYCVAMGVSAAERRLVVVSAGYDSMVRAWDVHHASGATLAWSSKGLHQALDAKGACMEGAVGLVARQQLLLAAAGAP